MMRVQVLRYHVATLVDNELLVSIHPHRSGRVLKTLRQRLKGKEGRIKEILGEHVDFSYKCYHN